MNAVVSCAAVTDLFMVLENLNIFRNLNKNQKLNKKFSETMVFESLKLAFNMLTAF